MFSTDYGPLNELDDARKENQQLFTRMNARLTELEAKIELAISNNNYALANSGSVNGDGSLELSALRKRLDAFESRTAIAEGPTEEQGNSPQLTKNEMETGFKEWLEQSLQVKPALSELRHQFQTESGQSNWGENAKAQVDWSYGNSIFFNENGGGLNVDCRQSACAATWKAPALTGLTPEEADQLMTLAGYEMLDVVARNNQDVGLFELATQYENGRGQIILHFARSPSP